MKGASEKLEAIRNLWLAGKHWSDDEKAWLIATAASGIYAAKQRDEAWARESKRFTERMSEEERLIRKAVLEYKA